MWAGLAIVVFAAATVFDYRWLRTFAWPIYLVEPGPPRRGPSSSATRIGGVVALGHGRLGFQFQFSELAKILMIIVLANYLGRRRAEARLADARSSARASSWRRRGSSSCSSPTSARRSCSGRSSPGCSSCPARACAGWVRSPPAVLAAVPIVWTYVLHDYQKQRLIELPRPGRRPAGRRLPAAAVAGAVGSGGLLGKGLTNGAQDQSDLLPVQTTDFVFAILAEELGFVGAHGRLPPLRGPASGGCSRRAGARATRSASWWAAGIASMILFQLIVNVGMVLGIMPITGIPLPFVTHGGASLISLAIGLGILQSITSASSGRSGRVSASRPPRRADRLRWRPRQRPPRRRPPSGARASATAGTRSRRARARRSTRSAVVPWTTSVNRTIPKTIPWSSSRSGVARDRQRERGRDGAAQAGPVHDVEPRRTAARARADLPFEPRRAAQQAVDDDRPPDEDRRRRPRRSGRQPPASVPAAGWRSR